MKEFIDAMKNYAVFKGRTSRSGYLMFMVWNIIISFVLALLAHLGSVFEVLITIYQILLFVPTFSISARRLHDINKSGWFQLLPVPVFILGVIAIPFVKIVGIIVIAAACILSLGLLCLLCFKKGDQGDNRFGPAVAPIAPGPLIPPEVA